MPNGTRRPVRAFKLNWHALDFILDFTDTTEVEIAGIAHAYGIEFGLSYEEAFFDTVTTLHKDARKNLGIDP